MKIKFKGSQDDLKKIHAFIYENDKDTIVNEEYEVFEGFQREPVVIALIATLTPIILKLIDLKVSKIIAEKEITLKEIECKMELKKAQIDINTQILKMYIENEGKWKEIDVNDLKSKFIEIN